MNLSIVTLCDSFGRLNEGGYDEPIDLVLCLGDLDNQWLALHTGRNGQADRNTPAV